MASKVTYDEIKALFEPWLSRGEIAGDRASSPQEAAILAFLAALNTDGKRGQIRVLVANSDDRRCVRNFLESFATEQPRLKQLVKRITPDAIKLNGGVDIVIDQNEARLATNSLATIILKAKGETKLESKAVVINTGDALPEAAEDEILIVLEMTPAPERPIDPPLLRHGIARRISSTEAGGAPFARCLRFRQAIRFPTQGVA
jgi:hypothetical protein